MSAQPSFPNRTPHQLVPMRWYQRAALDAVHSARERGVNRQLVILPTGAGKTHVAANAVAELGMRTVFMVHRDELAKQTVKQVRQVNPSLSIGIVKADLDETSREFIVVSAQTIARQPRLDRLVRALDGEPILFISDEAHHDRSETRMRAINAIAPDLLIGLTATPSRSDGLGLDAIYQEIVYHLPMRTLVGEKYLARPVGLRIETEADLDAVHTRAGEFAENELADTVDTSSRNSLIVQSWRTHAADRQRTIAFCVNVAHAEHLRDAFRADGVAAEMVDGGTPVDERERIYAAFHSGDVAVLTNCMVLTEGYDESAINCVLMCRPTKSTGLYQQCVGRGLRPFPGKVDCLVIDYVDATTRHQLVTLPSLAGADEPKQKGTPLSEGDREAGQVMDLFDASDHHGKIRERAAIMLDLLEESPFTWQLMPDGMAMVPSQTKGAWYTVIAQGDGYIPVRLTSLDCEPLFDRPVEIDMAMGIAESQISALGALNDKNARWRLSPASEKQYEAAAKWRVPTTPHMTRGQISDLLDVASFRAALRRQGLDKRRTA